MDFGNIIVREDGSYVIKGGLYHVPNEGEFAELWLQVDEYAKANPGKVAQEVEPELKEPTQEEIEAQALAVAKRERAKAVERLTVEVEGMVFDADEVSQQRVARSIVALQEGETMPWVLYDNTIVQVNKSQLMQVLRLAGQKQCELWVKPYENASA